MLRATVEMEGPVRTTESAEDADRKPDRRLRVLMILDSFSFGGAENLIAELARYDQAEFDLTVASLTTSGGDRDAMLGRLREAGLAPSHLSIRRLADPVGFLRLVRTLRRAPADVVHAHLQYSAILVSLAAWIARKPVVATLHLCPQPREGRREWVKEHLSVRMAAMFGRVVFVSQYAFDEYARVHGPARRSWRMVPNGVDLERYGARPRRQSGEAPVWAAVAALRAEKNHVDLVRAWSKVVVAHPAATLLIVGDGPSRGEIESAVAAVGLQDSIRFLGRRDDVPELLRHVDGVVSASVDEALPTALLEAGASGLPVVAADAGGTREIVRDGVNGHLVPMRDVPALTAALLNVVGNPELAMAFGRAGRDLVEQRYSFRRWIDELSALYEEVRRS